MESPAVIDTCAGALHAPGRASFAPASIDPAASRQAAGEATGRILETLWARHADEVRQAQALRWQVFAQEMGAQLNVPPGTAPGLDVDHWDSYCEHIIVRTVETANAPAEVVGTYRVLTPDGARRAGGLYSATEFDLSALRHLLPRTAELGRSCTASAWRNGGVIMMLWASLAEFTQRNGLDRMLGCASVPMQDGGHLAASLWEQLRHKHLVDETLRVHPLLPLPVDQLNHQQPAEAPPLVKGYLRCGAQLLGSPAWDPAFGVADLPMIMDMSRLSSTYRTRFARALGRITQASASAPAPCGCAGR